MKTALWVTYKTSHPTGFYYCGKSNTARIKRGYQGSGYRLKAIMLHPGFTPDTWKTEVIDTFTTEQAAYAAEAQLVPLSLLTDPYCLNSQPGGQVRTYGSPYVQLLRAAGKAKSAPGPRAARRHLMLASHKRKKLQFNIDGTVRSEQ